MLSKIDIHTHKFASRHNVACLCVDVYLCVWMLICLLIHMLSKINNHTHNYVSIHKMWLEYLHYGSYMTLIGVHELHGQMHPNQLVM